MPLGLWRRGAALSIREMSIEESRKAVFVYDLRHELEGTAGPPLGRALGARIQLILHLPQVQHGSLIIHGLRAPRTCPVPRISSTSSGPSHRHTSCPTPVIGGSSSLTKIMDSSASVIGSVWGLRTNEPKLRSCPAAPVGAHITTQASRKSLATDTVRSGVPRTASEAVVAWVCHHRPR